MSITIDVTTKKGARFTYCVTNEKNLANALEGIKEICEELLDPRVADLTMMLMSAKERSCAPDAPDLRIWARETALKILNRIEEGEAK